MEQLYFQDIAVGPTLFKLLKSAKRRFMRFEFSADREGTKQFIRSDTYGCAHMPTMAVEWVVSKQTNVTISTALTELFMVNYSNLDIHERRYVHLNISARNVREGLKQYLSTCLTWLLLEDDEVEAIALERFHIINSGSLANYGCSGKKIRRIQKLQIDRVDGEGVCCGGREIKSCSHPCDRRTHYRIRINSRKTAYTCDWCFRWFFYEHGDNAFGLWR